MQKLAEFIVARRRAILALAVVLSVAAAFATTLVTINKDLTRYLPEDSNTGQGIAIMNEEFPESVPLRVMYEGLAEGESADIADGLAALPHVDSVTVEEGGPDGPSAGKTLFNVNLEGGTYSDTAKAGLAEVQEFSAGRDAAIAGPVVDAVDQARTLELTIALAVGIGLVILFVMCASWVEPFLFLLTIGIAIILNMGTNIIFPSVSETTFSIAAVLQLALSMDYSIMLTDRYRQERAVTDDKAKAMVGALRGGFTAIASSSVTTIAGMVCLVVMSFTIGRDMGLVLAKGVAFSILCVLFVLPGLMVACDTAIQKTRKPSPKPKLRRLAAFSYTFRYGILAVFALLIVASFVVKGSVGITFFMDSSNADKQRIDEAFGVSEQVVALYGKDDAVAAEAVASFADHEFVDSLQSYEGTLGQTATADELAGNLGMDPAIVRLLYYTKAHGTEPASSMGVNELARFIQGDVAANEQFAGALDEAMLAEVGTLATLSDPEQIRLPRTPADMAALLGIDAAQVEQLYLYYFMQAGAIDPGTATLAAFVAFLQDGIMGNDAYAGMLDEAAQAQVAQLARLADAAAVTAPLDAAGLSELLGMDAALIERLFQYQVFSTADMTGYALGIPQVLGIVVDRVATDPQYAGAFDEAALGQLAMLRTLAETAAAGTALDAGQLAELLGMDPALVQQLFGLYGTLAGTGAAPQTMALPAFMALLMDSVATNPDVLASLDPAQAELLAQQAGQLGGARAIVDAAAAGTALNPDGMAGFLGMDAMLMRQAYLLQGLDDGTFALPQMSAQSFLAYVLEVIAGNPQFQGAFDEAALAQLQQARAVVDTAVGAAELDAGGLGAVLGMDPAQVAQLLMVRTFMQNPSAWPLTLEQLLPFALQLVDGGAPALPGGNAGSAVSEDDAAALRAANDIVAGALAGTSYTAENMAALLGRAAGDLDANTVKLLYLYRESIAGADPAQRMTIEEFVAYAADMLAGDALFSGVADDAALAELDEAKTTLADAKSQLIGPEHARAILSVPYARDSVEMSALVGNLRDVLDATGSPYYLVGDGPMGIEMQGMFADEFNFITVLTAVVIFIIVAVTFRSVAVPLVLVLLIQTAINLTMGLTALTGVGIYYIALMVVQALLMGATIDYAILFTTCYREARAVKPPREALAQAFPASIGTIMTSASILVFVLLVVGLTSSDVTISEVCLTIAKGSFVAVVLVLALLPGILAALDRLVAGRHAYRAGGAASIEPLDGGAVARAEAAERAQAAMDRRKQEPEAPIEKDGGQEAEDYWWSSEDEQRADVPSDGADGMGDEPQTPTVKAPGAEAADDAAAETPEGPTGATVAGAADATGSAMDAEPSGCTNDGATADEPQEPSHATAPGGVGVRDADASIEPAAPGGDLEAADGAPHAPETGSGPSAAPAHASGVPATWFTEDTPDAPCSDEDDDDDPDDAEEYYRGAHARPRPSHAAQAPAEGGDDLRAWPELSDLAVTPPGAHAKHMAPRRIDW